MVLQDNLASGQEPTHTFIPNRGYVDEEGNQPSNPQDPKDFDEETDEEYDDILEADSEEAAEYALSQGGNIANAYNRHRKAQEVSADPNAPKSQMPKSNPQKPFANIYASVDDQSKDLTRHVSKLKLDNDMAGLSEKRPKGMERADRATTEQVMDPRTKMILLQMINRNIVSEVHGCVSTGKEANVYHAISVPEDDPEAKPMHRAIKVYKTRILVFKDRERYVAGEHRFQSGYKKGNNREKVRQWAEKEFRNLKRVHAAGIPCPEPLYLRIHVLMMEFLGDKKGNAAPKLKDITFEEDEQENGWAEKKWKELYLSLLGYMRILYSTCRLVHGDLSEYNILYHKNKLWIIDVSQSVEHDHPRSLEFLRTDIKNVNDFFARKGVDTLIDRTVFEFVTSITSPTEHEAVVTALQDLFAQPRTSESTSKEVDNEVFRQQFIPQTLDQVYDAERDVEQMAEIGKDNLVYRNLLPDKPTTEDDDNARDSGVGSTSDRSDEESGSDSDEFAPKRPRGRRFEDKDEKKAHKQQVKEEKREKRQNKIPKHVKKRAIALSKKSKS
jgi:RIO kinase 1